jgi:phage terminase large subunit-like protein
MVYEAPQELTDAELDADPVKYGKMANPAWGHTVGEEEYLGDYNESKVSIPTLADFKMYRLNIWQRTANPWLRPDDWAKCRQEFTEADLYGKPCGGGLDLSKTEDMTSFSLVFPEEEADEEEDKPVKVLWWFWLPDAAIERHGHEVAYAQWAADGWLRVIPGATVDYSFVERDLVEILEQFDVRCFAYDEKYAHELVNRLQDEHGYTGELYAFPQANCTPFRRRL